MMCKVIVQEKTKQTYMESKRQSWSHNSAYLYVRFWSCNPIFQDFWKVFSLRSLFQKWSKWFTVCCFTKQMHDTELCFIPETVHLLKPILILECYGSSIHLDVIDLLVKNKIILHCLPLHTTNILQQPLNL